MNAKTKKIVGGTVAVSLVAALAVGGTFAYLTHETERRVNNFTFAESDVALNAMLTEPDWDGVIDYEYSEDGKLTPIYEYREIDNEIKPVYGYTDGDYANPVTNKNDINEKTTRATKNTGESGPNSFVYGIDQSKSMIPGSVAKKNPIITNTGNQADSWVAAKITFVYAQDITDNSGNTAHSAGAPLSKEDMTAVNDIIEIDYNTEKWEQIDINNDTDGTSKIFYYKTLLKMDTDENKDDEKTTAPIFTTVSVKKEATNEELDKLNAIGGFDIYIEGFAAQDITGLNSENSITYDAFKTWGIGTDNTAGTDDDNVKFSHTPTADAPATITNTIDIT